MSTGIQKYSFDCVEKRPPFSWNFFNLGLTREPGDDIIVVTVVVKYF
jgi:hypothetical protein